MTTEMHGFFLTSETLGFLHLIYTGSFAVSNFGIVKPPPVV